MANRYWVGGGGTWDDSSTTHWSTSSGGSSGASAPGTADTAIFDANSGGGSVNIATSNNCNGLTSTGFTGSFSGSQARLNGGSVTLGKPVALYVAPGASVSLTSNGNSIGYSSFYGTVTCADAIIAASLTLTSGTALTLLAGSTNTVQSFTWPASAGAVLNSSSPGTRATLSDSSGTNNIDYISVTDIAFAGAATWYWGTGYTDGGNNTGISSPPASAAPIVLFGPVA